MPPLRCVNSSSAAKLFVQLSMRRSISTTSVLDVLLPSRTAAARALSYRGRADPRTRTELPSRLVRLDRSQHVLQQRRAFSASVARRATHAVFNPQKDDDGNDMLLEITPRAAHRLSQIMAKDANPHLALRIQVESGGCHGFQYLMSLVTLPSTLPTAAELAELAEADDESAASSPVIREDDTIFSFSSESDSSSPASSAATGAEADRTAAPKIILDQPSLELLKGSKVDFTMELIGSQFKIVDNPAASSSCGCGTSFDIKV